MILKFFSLEDNFKWQVDGKMDGTRHRFWQDENNFMHTFSGCYSLLDYIGFCNKMRFVRR